MTTQRKKILIVEDHQDSRTVLTLLLKRNGFDVRSAATKHEASQLCEAEAFDILIGDLELPDGSGYEVMLDIASRCSVKGIALTGHSSDSVLKEVREAGFAAHLLKPVQYGELLAIIKRLLNEDPIQTKPPISDSSSTLFNS